MTQMRVETKTRRGVMSFPRSLGELGADLQAGCRPALPRERSRGQALLLDSRSSCSVLVPAAGPEPARAACPATRMVPLGQPVLARALCCRAEGGGAHPAPSFGSVKTARPLISERPAFKSWLCHILTMGPP